MECNAEANKRPLMPFQPVASRKTVLLVMPPEVSCAPDSRLAVADDCFFAIGTCAGFATLEGAASRVEGLLAGVAGAVDDARRAVDGHVAELKGLSSGIGNVRRVVQGFIVDCHCLGSCVVALREPSVATRRCGGSKCDHGSDAGQDPKVRGGMHMRVCGTHVGICCDAHPMREHAG